MAATHLELIYLLGDFRGGSANLPKIRSCQFLATEVPASSSAAKEKYPSRVDGERASRRETVMATVGLESDSDDSEILIEEVTKVPAVAAAESDSDDSDIVITGAFPRRLSRFFPRGNLHRSFPRARRGDERRPGRGGCR